jgi:hypothetical protein
MTETTPAAVPSDALRKQLESDAGPHPTPDAQRAADKRRAAARTAAGLAPDQETRSTPPAERKSAPKQTT